MKQLLITTIAALVLVGCGPSVPDIDINVAASTGDIKAVNQYLAAGGDVNAKDKVAPPLYYAAKFGHKEITELLIEKGADINLRSGMVVNPKDGSEGNKMAQKIANNRTPLDMAIDKHTEIADFLRKHGGKTGEELKVEDR